MSSENPNFAWTPYYFIDLIESSLGLRGKQFIEFAQKS